MQVRAACIPGRAHIGNDVSAMHFLAFVQTTYADRDADVSGLAPRRGC